MTTRYGTWKRQLNDNFGFGKYKTKTVRWVIDNNIWYVKWALLNTRFDLSKEADKYYSDMMEDKND